MKDKLEQIRERIQAATEACGRDPATVRLVAVSKTQPVSRIAEAIAAGATDLGENYIQEAKEKIESLAGHSVCWHFIGHLQSNKAKIAVSLFDWIHTVDSVKLAAEIDKHAAKLGKVQKILIQVNTGQERSKSGVAPEDMAGLVTEISRFAHVTVQGLMAIPPFYADPEAVRPHFKKLRMLRDAIEKQQIPNVVMEELSMGMSGDFDAAIAEGATMVRIGTAIFGARQ
ncbi:YggS family pyridoxal phosphate-dependent enzyme [Desulfosudis oleivorans]|uniref:Pyridoxal phosphate homeostasis protein n=1 Tax=Desulfosudis oleivorans (strain DSM 6200 / JCM 39069 / Hxd3) TaxID=96561 RepID=A8ZXM7_DESOH|nr:YggS family pyridoxal phosphate-dependent enzyme [Desulfosudis oleivorans]ABW66985.1 alanine racemase domain protein [Desulfosudis oleivorans Hxd3]